MKRMNFVFQKALDGVYYGWYVQLTVRMQLLTWMFVLNHHF